MKIGVLGHYTTPNMGDEASAEAVISNIKKLDPNIDVVCIAPDPKTATKLYSVESYPIRRQSKKINIGQQDDRDQNSASLEALRKSAIYNYKVVVVFRKIARKILNIPSTVREIVSEIFFLYHSKKRLKNFDAIVVAGSGTLLDEFGGGPWSYPYTLFKWSMISRLSNVKFMFICSGAIPFKTRLGKWFVLNSLKLSNYVSFRDDYSKHVCKQIGFMRESPVYPDVVHSLDFEVTDKIKTIPQIYNIGINPVPIYGDEFDSEDTISIYHSYINCMKKVSMYINKIGHKVCFYSTHTRDIPIINDILNTFSDEEQKQLNYEIINCNRTSDFKILCENIDFAISCRFHALVVPLNKAIPTIAICSHDKQRSLMRSLGMEKYIVELNNLDYDHVSILLDDVIKNQEKLAKTLQLRAITYRKKLQEQYKFILDQI